jgi:hypothetical protein
LQSLSTKIPFGNVIMATAAILSFDGSLAMVWNKLSK